MNYELRWLFLRKDAKKGFRQFLVYRSWFLVFLDIPIQLYYNAPILHERRTRS